MDWLPKQPDSGLFPRQIPMCEVDSKWLEQHLGLVKQFVGATTGRIDLGLAQVAKQYWTPTRTRAHSLGALSEDTLRRAPGNSVPIRARPPARLNCFITTVWLCVGQR
ncbi:MAG: DUF3322 domain-containing protein [Propionibacteriaceae bacterium]|nr:DUF3322 domain-containing protein [Propionibacteriaceae bacterium]